MTAELFVLNPKSPERDSFAPAAIANRIADGDTEAFGELYRRYSPMVHGIILARVRQDEVDDIVQDVFVAAFEKIGTLRDKAAVGGWLAMIARNHATEFHRTERPTEELPEELPDSRRPDVEAREALNMIRQLPDAYRETLVLRLVEGMSGPEIAALTGMTHDSVRVNLHRGMKMLRERAGMTEKLK